MKTTAAAYASQGAQLTEADAQRLVVQYMRDAGVSPWPPPDALAFLASEMLEMVGRGEEQSPVA